MRHFISLILVGLLFSSCGPGKGSLTGNVYWKYNNFIGNKPDAGSKVLIYPYSKNSQPMNTTADVQGNYKFDNINAGDYLLIVISKNTTSSPKATCSNLIQNKGLLKDVFDFDFSSIKQEKINEFLILDSLVTSSNMKITFDLPIEEQNKESEIQEKREKELNTLSQDIIQSIPTNISKQLDLLFNKIELKRITIQKDKNTTVVTDFGITYM